MRPGRSVPGSSCEATSTERDKENRRPCTACGCLFSLGGYRIAKDPETRTHACLIPREELDELSVRENEITGGSVDYKQYDIQNVLALPKLLRAEEEREKD